MTIREKYPVVTDALERVVNTAWQTAAAVLTADGVNLVDLRDMCLWQYAGVAGLGAGWTLLKTLVATQIKKRNGQPTSASFAPSVQLQPTDAASR